MTRPGTPSYAEFSVQTNFSFLRGASRPEELIVKANKLGLAAVGVADCNTVSGVVRAWSMAKEARLPYHPGCRLVFSDGHADVLAYPRDRPAWGRLCRMLTAANMRGEKGAPDLRHEDLLEWGDGLSLAVITQSTSAPETELASLKVLRDRFGKAVRLAVAPSYNGNDRFCLAQADALARAAGIPLMAINNVLYHEAARRSLQDVVTAIRLRTTIAQAGLELAANAERHLKAPGEMARLFRHYPEAIRETGGFAAELEFKLSELRYNYPDEPTESGLPPQEELERLAFEGAKIRYPKGVPETVTATIQRELGIIAKLKYARYFLTVYDIVKFARSKGILCQGRGSAANSVVCYCIGITEIGPDIITSLFERFISEKRNEPPDIDVDFEHERRDEVIAYIYEKYSNQRTALAAAVISYRSRSSLRETAKALGISDDTIAALSASTWRWTTDNLGKTEAGSAGLDMQDGLTRHLLGHANQIMGFPRHLSQHSGGFVITKDRLDEIVPITKTAMEERMMIEWDKDDLDAVGLLKVDILALGMLSCLKRAFDLLRDVYGLDLNMSQIMDRRQEEDAVYAMIQRADTIGVFQIESRAQMSMLPRLKPKEFYDLVIEVAIVRPGPIQGEMVHPYLRRREGLEEAEYPKPELKAILGKTLGVPLFQEQAMQIAIVAGGFTADQADELRRAMATFRRVGTIGSLRQKMIDGMEKRGYRRDFAERCFKQIEGFGEYGFPESHAASFALLVYVSCWFKTYYPDIFCAAILNAQPMGFYAPAQLVRDAREHGVALREVDINHSHWDCTLEEIGFEPGHIAPKHASMRGVIRSRNGVRLGFRQIKGLKKAELEKLIKQRGKGYDSVRDLWLRTGLPASTIVRLAEADAFRSLGLDRRTALWAARALDAKAAPESLPLFIQPEAVLRDFEPETHLPAMPLGEHVIHDYRTLSLSLKAHPLSFLRGTLMRERTLPCADLRTTPNGRFVSVAGLVLVRQRPGSAKGVIFMSMEDETGIANIIVWQKTFEQFRPIVLGARVVRVSGKLQHQGEVIHVVAHRIEDLTGRLAELSELGPTIHGLANSDEVRRPIRDAASHRKPSVAVTRLIRDVPELKQDYEELAKRSAKVMPRGRNFQ